MSISEVPIPAWAMKAWNNKTLIPPRSTDLTPQYPYSYQNPPPAGKVFDPARGGYVPKSNSSYFSEPPPYPKGYEKWADNPAKQMRPMHPFDPGERAAADRGFAKAAKTGVLAGGAVNPILAYTLLGIAGALGAGAIQSSGKKLRGDREAEIKSNLDLADIQEKLWRVYSAKNEGARSAKP